MNTGRFLTFLDFLLAKEKQFQVQEALAQLAQSVASLTDQPQSPEIQNSVSTSLARLKEAANGLALAMSPAQVDMLSEIQGGEMLGPSLSTWVSDWIAANAMTPAVARDEINGVVKRRNVLLGTISDARGKLVALGVRAEEPPMGQVELGFLIPRDIFENDFDRFREELKFLSRTVALYSEAATGEVEPITIGEISSSDPLLFLGISVTTVLAISGTIKWLLDALKTSLEIRDLLNKSKAAGLPPSLLAGFENEINGRLDRAVEERVAVVLASYPQGERRNELSNGLTIMTKELLGRIERGMKVEIKLSHNPEVVEPQEGEPLAHASEFAQVAVLAQELVFPRLTGDALIQIGSHGDNDGTQIG